MMITISVKLFASLAKYKPPGIVAPVFNLELHEGNTVESLLLQLDVPRDKVKTISLNDKIVKSNTVLRNDDVVVLFPTIAGG